MRLLDVDTWGLVGFQNELICCFIVMSTDMSQVGITFSLLFKFFFYHFTFPGFPFSYINKMLKSDGYNPKSQQHAVFNSLIYRLFNTPLKQTEYTREYEHILNTVVTNGFDKN